MLFNNFIKYVLVLFFYTFVIEANATGGFINIKQAFEEGKIDVEIASLGCYNDECARIFITNKVAQTLLIEIDAGQLLDPFEPDFQPFLIKEKHRMAIPEGVEKELLVEVFCANMKKSVPKNELQFTFADSTPSKWYQLTNYLAMNDISSDLGQKAVWCLTNRFPLAAVCNKDKAETARLRKYMLTLINGEAPWMDLFFKTDSAGMPTNELEAIRLEVDYAVRNNTMMSFYITNERGQLVKQLAQRIPRNPGKYTYEVEFSVEGWPFGTYHLIMRSPEQLLKKQPFTLKRF